MSVSEEARVFQVRGFRCSKEPTVLGLSPVRLGMQIANVKQRQILPRVGKIWVRTPQNRTYRAWRTTKLTPMVRFPNCTGLPAKSCLSSIYFQPRRNKLESRRMGLGYSISNLHHQYG